MRLKEHFGSDLRANFRLALRQCGVLKVDSVAPATCRAPVVGSLVFLKFDDFVNSAYKLGRSFLRAVDEMTRLNPPERLGWILLEC